LKYKRIFGIIEAQRCKESHWFQRIRLHFQGGTRANVHKNEIESRIEYYTKIGNDAAMQMREYFTKASEAFQNGAKSSAKELSLTGHDYKGKAEEANRQKNVCFQESKTLRSIFDNTPLQVQIRNLNEQVKNLQNDFNSRNEQRKAAKESIPQLEAAFQAAKSEFEKLDAEPKTVFTDIMDLGIMLVKQIRLASKRKQYPDYLEVKKVIRLELDSRIDPSKLTAKCAYIYNDNLYVTDAIGNIAFIDCEMIHTDDAATIRQAHPEYKSVGGSNAKYEEMDAGHFGISLGQHPSIAVEQHRIMNRYGAWRNFERNWNKLSLEGHSVNVKAVFVEDIGDSTFSPFWCIRETIDGSEMTEYTLTNDSGQS
jgi:hypothetical protein